MTWSQVVWYLRLHFFSHCFSYSGSFVDPYNSDYFCCCFFNDRIFFHLKVTLVHAFSPRHCWHWDQVILGVGLSGAFKGLSSLPAPSQHPEMPVALSLAWPPVSFTLTITCSQVTRAHLHSNTFFWFAARNELWMGISPEGRGGECGALVPVLGSWVWGGPQGRQMTAVWGPERLHLAHWKGTLLQGQLCHLAQEAARVISNSNYPESFYCTISWF